MCMWGTNMATRLLWSRPYKAASPQLLQGDILHTHRYRSWLSPAKSPLRICAISLSPTSLRVGTCREYIRTYDVHTVTPASLMSTHSSWSSPHQSPTTYKWIVAGGRGLGTARSPRPLQSTAYCVPAVLNLKQMHTRGHCAAVSAHSSSRRKRMRKAAVECVRIIRSICDPSACLRRPYSHCTRLPRPHWSSAGRWLHNHSCCVTKGIVYWPLAAPYIRLSGVLDRSSNAERLGHAPGF